MSFFCSKYLKQNTPLFQECMLMRFESQVGHDTLYKSDCVKKSVEYFTFFLQYRLKIIMQNLYTHSQYVFFCIFIC